MVYSPKTSINIYCLLSSPIAIIFALMEILFITLMGVIVVLGLIYLYLDSRKDV